MLHYLLDVGEIELAIGELQSGHIISHGPEYVLRAVVLDTLGQGPKLSETEGLVLSEWKHK